jgi:hypothetical protein
VDVEDFRFAPARVGGAPGKTVTWQKAATIGAHNVNSRTGMFRSGAPTSSPFTYSRTFSAGRYAYRCQVHEAMTGEVRIRPSAALAPDGKPFTVRWATAATNTGGRFTVQYRVNGGDWRTWRRATTSRAGVFGRNGAPVTVRAGRTYSLRVRSIKGDNRSAFSPVRSVTP